MKIALHFDLFNSSFGLKFRFVFKLWHLFSWTLFRTNTKNHLSIDIFSIRWGWIINWNKCLNLIVRFSGMKSIRSFERTVTVMKFISMKLDLQLANSLSQFHGFRNSFVYLIALLWYFFVWNIWGIYVISIEFSTQIENEFRQCRIGSPKLEQVSTSELLT